MRKETSSWLISCLMKTLFASARETLKRGWITCLKICNYVFAKLTRDSDAIFSLFSNEGVIDFYICVLGTITRSQGSTTGT